MLCYFTSKKSKKLGKIKIICITPLRVLNCDVFRRIIKYTQGDNLSIEVRHGDTIQTARQKNNCYFLFRL